VSIILKRANGEPSQDDEYRVLVDRFWPRGVSKEQIPIDAWLKEIAPSNELRRWIGHDPQKWDQFKQRDFEELQAYKEPVQGLLHRIEAGPLTLVYAAKDKKYNNAVALKEYLLSKFSNP